MDELVKKDGNLYFVDANECATPLCCPFKNIYQYDGAVDFTDSTGTQYHVETDDPQAAYDLLIQCNAVCNPTGSVGEIVVNVDVDDITIEKPPKEWRANGYYYDPVADPKGESPICTDIYMDTETGAKCEFLEGTPIGQLTEENIFDNTNLIKMLGQGIHIPENLAAKTTSDCVVVCLEPEEVLTEAELLALYVEAGVLLPDDTEPTGLINPIVTPIYPGQQALDSEGVKKKIKSGGCTVVDGKVVNPGTPYCEPKKELIDDDCDNFIIGETITITNTGTEVIAVRVCATLIPLDSDDTDSTVQGATQGEGRGEG